MTQENQTHVKDTAKNVMARNNPLAQGRQLALWIGALIFGAVSLDERSLPQPTLQLHRHRLHPPLPVHCCTNHRLAVITTLSMMGSKEETKKIFKHTITYTLLTTICAAGIGLLLYLWIQPGNLPTEAIGAGRDEELHPHLLELTGAEGEVARGDLVTEGLTHVAMPNGGLERERRSIERF